MSVEPATLGDLSQLVELLGFLFAQEADFHPDIVLQAKGVRRILDDPGVGRILVFRENGRAVGLVNLLFTVSTALGATVAILDDIVVHPEHRGKGIGSQLLDAAIALCKAEGCARIHLHTDHDNHGAQRLYERHGFTRSTMLSMRLHL
ncbi:MAG: GNAT family N-acetyltransferase [Candidatus Hydrogenedentes bacterium]|nr:GNAT family N-acetyltransferase [Candidatus Hydrogenedentota bacterium]